MTLALSPARCLRRLALCALCAMAALPAAPYTVVIDAGHGGRDHGTVGAHEREKDINLDVAKRVRDILMKEHQDVRVVMTRSTDVFVPLQERCDIANLNKGDIFVSIHTNSVDYSNPRRSTVEGASVYTLGQRRADTNLDVAMRENSVIKLEDDYSTTYCGFDPSSTESYIIFELTQSAHLDNSIRLAGEIQAELIETAGRKDMGVRQEPFWVLVRTSMPAVLVELDYICNPQVETFLGSDKGRSRLARSIANGIAAYRGQRPSARHAAPATAPQSQETAKAAETAAAAPASTAAPDDKGTVYRIQFLTSPSPISPSSSKLKGLPAESYRQGGLHKYTTGRYTSQREAEKALPAVRAKFADAFIVVFQDGRRVK